MKTLKRIFLAILILCIILVTVVFLWPKKNLITKIEKQLSSQLQASVDIGNIQPSLFGLRAKKINIEAMQSKGLNVKADTFLVKVALLPLLKKNVVLKKLLLKDAKIEYNLDHEASPNNSDQASTGNDGYALNLKDISLKNVSVDILSNNKTYVLLENIDHNMSLQSNDMNIFDIDAKTHFDKMIFNSSMGSLGRGLSPDFNYKMRLSLKDSKIDIQNFKLKDNSIAGELSGTFENFSTLNSDFNLKLSSPSLDKLIAMIPSGLLPNDSVRSSKGQLDMNMNFLGLLTDTSQAKFSGNMNLKQGEMVYAKKIEDIEILADFDQKHFNLKSFKARTQKSNINLKAALSNYLSSQTGAVNIKAKLLGHVDFQDLLDVGVLDANDFSSIEGVLDSNIDMQGNSDSPNISGDLKLKQFAVKYGQYPSIKDLNINSKWSKQNADFESNTFFVNKHKYKADGTIANILPYILEGKTLQYNVNLKADHFNIDEWLVSSDEDLQKDETTVAGEYDFLKQYNGQIDFKADLAKYSDYEFTKASGKLKTKNGRLSIDNLKGEVFSGSTLSSFVCDLSDKKMPFSGSFNSEKLSIKQILLLMGQNSKGKTALSALDMNGILNSDIKFSGFLDPITLSPVITKANLEGPIDVSNGYIKKTKLQQTISQYLKVDAIKDIEFSNLKQYIKFDSGNVLFKNINLQAKDFDVKGEGKQSLNGDIDFNLDLNVPKAYLKNIPQASILDSLGYKDTDKVLLPINLKGSYAKPKITVNTQAISEMLQKRLQDKLTNNVQDSIKDVIKNPSNEKKSETIDKIKEKVKKFKLPF